MSLVFELDQIWNVFFFFYRISELMLATLIQRYDKKSFHFKNETNFTGCQVPHFMIVLILYINLSNLSWIIKCLFLGLGSL